MKQSIGGEEFVSIGVAGAALKQHRQLLECHATPKKIWKKNEEEKRLLRKIILKKRKGKCVRVRESTLTRITKNKMNI